MKIKQTHNPSLFLATYWNLSQKSFGPYFSLKICCIGQNHIFPIKNLQTFAQKRTLYLTSLGMIDGRD
jgi:hypothetical protein